MPPMPHKLRLRTDVRHDFDPTIYDMWTNGRAACKHRFVSTRSIGIIGFPGVMALDIVAPFDAFMNARADGRRAYAV